MKSNESSPAAAHFNSTAVLVASLVMFWRKSDTIGTGAHGLVNCGYKIIQGSYNVQKGEYEEVIEYQRKYNT